MSIDPLRSFSSHSPTRIRFGSGTIDEVGSLTAEIGDRALVVGANSAHTTGTVARCRTSLESAGVRVIVYDGTITPDPTVQQVNELATRIVKEGSNVVVALGGGSVMDCAKAAAVIARQGGSAEDHLSGDLGPVEVSLPVVAIPTTAGSGAELSKGAILSWPERGFKGGMRGDALAPDVAVVDPDLTLTVPGTQTRFTGFDAFAHAVETYVSRKATPLTEQFSSMAVVGIAGNLPRLVDRPDDLPARSAMSYHAMMMGYNLANSSTCLPHRLQYPLGARTQTAHGLGLAALFPSWVKITQSASEERFADVATWIGEGLGESFGGIEDALAAFMQRIGLRPDLSELGVKRADLKTLAAETSGSLGNDPWWDDDKELTVILDDALEKDTK